MKCHYFMLLAPAPLKSIYPEHPLPTFVIIADSPLAKAISPIGPQYVDYYNYNGKALFLLL